MLGPSFVYRHAEPAEDANVFAELGRRKLKMWAARFGSAGVPAHRSGGCNSACLTKALHAALPVDSFQNVI